ncbi:MAG: VWA domain-containing protein, partial [Deltaproteobacteria bacterium]|nr:VWA domain-containing protein [Deltaproteobacteria bacterium]
VRQLTADRQALARALGLVRWQPRRDDAARALQLAQSLLEGATDVPNRRVVVLTDLQASGWQAADMPVLHDRGQPVQTFVDRLAPDTLENTAIVDATVDRGADDAGGQVRVELALQHHGRKPWRDYVSVRAAEREFKSLVQLRPGELARRSFLVPVSAQWAEVVLPADALDADNRRLVRLDAATALKVAVINGAPRPVPRDDEAFFVAQALEAGGSGPGEVQLDRIAADKLSSATLADHDVVIAANLGSPPAQTAEALLEFARGGGGVLVTVGDNLPDTAMDYLAALLPASIGAVRSAAVSGGGPAAGVGLDQAGVDPARLCSAAAAIARELQQARPGLGDARTTRYALALPAAELASRTVLRFGDGAPALLAHGVGAGRVALWTTTIDRDWTDLPLQPAWLPFVHGTVRALAGPRALERKAAVEVGQTATLGRDDRAEQLQVRHEGGGGAGEGERVLQAVLQRPGQWSVPGLETPGRYVATELRGGAALNSRPIVVVAPASEGDLAPAATGPLATRAAQSAQPSTARTVPKSPVWTPALVGLLLLLVTEAALVARGAWPVQILVWRRSA